MIKTKQFASEKIAIAAAVAQYDPTDNFFPGRYQAFRFIKEFVAKDSEGDEIFRLPVGATGYFHVCKSFEYGRLSRSYIVLVAADGSEERLPKFENDDEAYNSVVKLGEDDDED